MDKRKYDREYHAKRSPEAKARKIKLQRLRVRKIAAHFKQFKANKGCIDCGEKDSTVLEFDHRKRASKEFDIADGTRLGWSIERIMQEVKKCDVVCANCHRRRTAKQFGWVQILPH